MSTEVLVAVLTLLAAAIPGAIEVYLLRARRRVHSGLASSKPRGQSPQMLAVHLALITSMVFVLVTGGFLYYNLAAPGNESIADLDTIVIAGKEFLESSLLVELIAQVIEEHRPDLEVRRLHYYGDSFRCFDSLRHGDIHIYPEYSTSMMNLHLGLDIETALSPEAHTRENMQERLDNNPKTRNFKWLAPFDFSNPYVLVMLRERAEELGLPKDPTLQDLNENRLSLVFKGQKECQLRRDCLGGITQKFPNLTLTFYSIEHDYKYKFLQDGQMDITMGYGTDPELWQNPDEYVLIDDDDDDPRDKWFAEYVPAPLVREELLFAIPGLEEPLAALASRVDQEDILALLQEATLAGLDKELAQQRTPRRKLKAICRNFLKQKDLVDS